MKVLTIGSAMIDTIAIIGSARIERMTMLNAESSFLLLEEGRKTDFAGLQNLVAVGGIADIGTRWPEGSVACDPTATSSIARSARYLNRQHMIL